MLQRLDEVIRRWQDLKNEQASPEVLTDRKRLLEVSKKLAEIDPVVAAYQAYRSSLTRSVAPASWSPARATPSSGRWPRTR
jgi:protein subunit release factor A